MRQLLVIYAIFAQVLLCFSAEAKAGFQSWASIETKAAYGAAKFFDEEHPSHIKGASFAARLVFKIRCQRAVADLLWGYYEPHLVHLDILTSPGIYASPLHIPLARLLLFPKHYFW